MHVCPSLPPGPCPAEPFGYLCVPCCIQILLAGSLEAVVKNRGQQWYAILSPRVTTACYEHFPHFDCLRGIPETLPPASSNA
jgi:hypothetical protein